MDCVRATVFLPILSMIEVLDLDEVSFAGTKLGCRFFVLFGFQVELACIHGLFSNAALADCLRYEKTFFCSTVCGRQTRLNSANRCSSDILGITSSPFWQAHSTIEPEMRRLLSKATSESRCFHEISGVLLARQK